MFVLFGTDDPEHNTVAFRGVTRVYTSIAPKDDKMEYLKYDYIRDGSIVITPLSKLREDKNLKIVHVVELFDNSEPIVLPVDKFVINFIDEKDLF